MTTKEILLEQLTITFDENGWFVAIKNALHHLSAKDAAWKPASLDNSIWETLAHLNFYNERWLKRFRGEAIPPSELENSETFAHAEEFSEADWQAEVEKFDAVMSGWRDALVAADEARFSEAVSAENQAPWGEVVSNINAHNAHHGGQIVVLRKLQGSWDASRGVS